MRRHVWLGGIMTTNLNRPLVASLFLTLGFMVAPLGASEPGKTAVCETTVCAAPACDDAAKADVCVDKKQCEVVSDAGVAKTNDEIVAKARVSRAHASRAKGAKNIREWFKFAFGKDQGKPFDTKYFLGSPTPTERAKNRRAWVEFAFGGSE